MWKLKKRKPSSVNISKTTSEQHIPAPKANRSFPIPFASCAIFWNSTILLNPSIAEEILKAPTEQCSECGLTHRNNERWQDQNKHS
jgi:hypothetical protein